jgi:hypothetical protein
LKNAKRRLCSRHTPLGSAAPSPGIVDRFANSAKMKFGQKAGELAIIHILANLVS